MELAACEYVLFVQAAICGRDEDFIGRGDFVSVMVDWFFSDVFVSTCFGGDAVWKVELLEFLEEM